MVRTAMATNSAVNGDDSKVILSCTVTPDVKASTNQHQQSQMMKNSEQKDICIDDAVDKLFDNFSIRDYVISVRAKDIKRNWPFSLKYLQICLENGRQPLLPPFESHKDVIDQNPNQEENSIAVNDKHKTNTVSDCSNNEKIKEPKDSKHGRREGWKRKQKNCKRKKRMVPGKARHDLISTENGKECNIIEDILHVEEFTEAKGDPKEVKQISTSLRQNDDKCPEAEKIPLNSCESKSTSYVPNTDIALILDSATGEQKNHTELADMHLNTKNGDEVRKKKGKKVVTSEHKQQEDDKEQNVEKTKEENGKNDDNGNSGCLPDALITKVCPVCKTFSSTSNTALNAHIDHCLSIESNCKRVGTKFGKPKVKSVKKRSLAEICAVAPICTLEDLERHILEDQSATEANQMPLDELNCKEDTTRKRHRQKAQSAHRIPKGKKLQKLSNLKEQCQTEKFQKFPKKRKRVVSTTSLQCAQDTSDVPDSISYKKKVYAKSPSKHDLIEDVLEDNLPSTLLVSAFVERPTVSGSTRVDTKEEMLTSFKQSDQEQESYHINNVSSTYVWENTSRNRCEEELQKSRSKSAVASFSEVHMTIPVQTNNVRQAEEILAKDPSPLEFSEISRHTSRMNSQSAMKQNIPRNESASGSSTMEEGSGPNTESANQASSKCFKSLKEVDFQSLGLVEEIQPQPNSVISTSCQDSQIPFSPQEAPMIGHLEKRISINAHSPSAASTEMLAHPPGVRIEEPTDEIEQVPALHEANERIFSPLISYENLNPFITLQRRVVLQNNSETQCFGISDAMKERARSISQQKQTLRQNPATQNDTSCLNLVTDASALPINSNRQFSSLTRVPVLPNIMHATSDICGSSSSAYLCNGLLVQQPNLHNTQIPSLPSNTNSNNMWTTETEHSSSRNMKERLHAPVQKLADVSGYAFGHSVCSSSSISSKGPALSFQGNMPQNRPLQARDSQYLNPQSPFGSMKLTSVTLPQVVSASTLSKQLDEGKTAEEILHGCIMIEQNLNTFSFQTNNAVQSSIHNKSMFPLENQTGSKHNLNNPLFGITNGSYGPNQVVGVAPYGHSVQKSYSSNRSFISGSPSTSGAVYSSGLTTNQGQSDNICVGNMDCSAETSMFGNPTLRLMGKNLMVTNKYGKQSKQLDANPINMTEYPNVSYLRLLGFTSGGKSWQDDTSLFGRSIDNSFISDQNMFSTLEGGVRSHESRSLWNQNDCNQNSTSVEVNISESPRNLVSSTSQKIVDANLPSAGLSWSNSNLVNSNMKFPSPNFQLPSVENRTSSRPIGADYQAKWRPPSVGCSQSDDTVIVIDDSPDLDTVPNMAGLESSPFTIRPSKFQEAISTSRIPGSDCMFSSEKTWPPTSSLPSHFSGCKESTTGCASNLQRVKDVQEELRRLGITNTGNSVKPSYVVHSQSGHEVIIIDDNSDAETVSNLPQPRQFQEGHPDSKNRSGNTWLQVSSIPNKFSACKESTLTCGLNHQRAKEVQAELRRLGITSPGIVQSPSAYLTPMRGG